MKNILFALSIAITFFGSYVSGLDQQNVKKEFCMARYKIVQRPSISLTGIEIRTSNDPDAGQHDIPKHWAKFYSEQIFDQIPNKTSNEVIALYCDYEGDYTKPYSFFIGCKTSPTSEIPEGMTTKEIPAATYALYYATGEYPKSLIDTWGIIWQSPLERTYSGDFEVYGEKFISGSPQEVDVYVAIEPRD